MEEMTVFNPAITKENRSKNNLYKMAKLTNHTTQLNIATLLLSFEMPFNHTPNIKPTTPIPNGTG